MKPGVIPKFSTEAKEAAWWDAHHSEIQKKIRQRMKQKRPLTLGKSHRPPEVTKVSLASSKSASDNGVVESPPGKGSPMAVAKLKRPKEDRFEELAERIATDINARAAKMTPKERARADTETKKIAAHVQRRTP